MIKRILFIFLSIFFLSSTANAGVYEDAIAQNDKVLLYFYTKGCSYCVKFNPIYENLVKNYSDKCKFVKIDANTEYGAVLAQKFSLKFVPYVMMIEADKQAGVLIPPPCLLRESCINKTLSGFVR